MFLCWVGESLTLKLCQCADDAEPGVARLDDIINIAVLGRIVRVGKEIGVFVLLLLDERRSILTLSLIHI